MYEYLLKWKNRPKEERKPLVIKGARQVGKTKIVTIFGENNYENISRHYDAQIIVNATPVGMYPRANEYPNIPYEYLTPNHLLYDLLYNPDTTLFMKKGADKGAIVKNGLEMLLLQAFASWDIWND